MENKLNDIYFKNCTKPCPNAKCGAKIALISGGCSQVQCTKCWHWFCWVCLQQAKGQKHFKERPDHWSDEGHHQPVEVTTELIERYLGMQDDPYVNVKTCCKCPRCGAINRKKGRKNLLTCEQCQGLFCFICNKAQESNAHYEGQSTCHEESDIMDDM